jgi:hypothetical protein
VSLRLLGRLELFGMNNDYTKRKGTKQITETKVKLKSEKGNKKEHKDEVKI